MLLCFSHRKQEKNIPATAFPQESWNTFEKMLNEEQVNETIALSSTTD